MTTQRSIFLAGEADAWYTRNRAALENPDRHDPVIAALQQNGVELRGARVLEIGCADGWRLHRLRGLGAADCVGIEPSAAAVAAGTQRYGGHGLRLRQGHASALRDPQQFDLIILAFVLHWLDRQDLVRMASALPLYLAEGAWLALADFLPLQPHAVPYHHKAGGLTFKRDYGAWFSSELGLDLIYQGSFDHDDPAMAWRDFAAIPDYSRCAVQLLRAGDPLT